LSPLLVAAALDTVVAPVHDEIYLHEWGVVVYEGDLVEALGSSGGPWFDPSELVVEAPVIHLYGPEFEGSLTVSSQGRIFNTYPDPDESFRIDLSVAGGSSAARWTGISTQCPWLAEPDPWSNALEVDIPGFYWALGIWRAVPSLLVRRSSDSFCDRFLYYEVDLSGRPLPLPLPGLARSGEAVLEGDVMLFRRTGDYETDMSLVPAEDLLQASEESTGRSGTYSCDEALQILEDWAGGTLKPEEIRAMWATWEPYVLYGDWEGDRLAVFPMPQDLIERISTIELTNTGDLPVYYNRFFLGIAGLI
jgi:hypothetical protein